MNRLIVSGTDRILIIAPHPDDESIGTGGLLGLYSNLCDIVVVTDGGRGGEAPVADMVATRAREFEKAMTVINAESCKLLGYPDGDLTEYPECFKGLTFSNYSKVFIPHKSELHADHKAVYDFFMKELSLIAEKDRPEVYQYETRMPIDVATHFLDITDVIETKLSMISRYESQCVEYDYVEFARSLAAFHACRDNYPGGYYEAYTKIDPERDMEAGSDDNLGRVLADYRKRNTYLEMWMELETGGRSLADHIRNNYNTVAIYGFGKFGRFLHQELATKGITVSYVLDKNAESIKGTNADIRIPQKYEDVDIVIVTNMFGIQEICDDLHDKGYCDVISLWDLMIDVKEQTTRSN